MGFRILGALAAATAMLALAPTPSAKTTVPARTADGRPDLQGNWTNATYTPLERPAELAGKEFFTEKEAAEYAQRRERQFNSQAPDDIHYDNAIWQSEPYQKGLSSLRTSLIYDPPDGRIPPLTPDGARRAAERAAWRRSHPPSEAIENRTLAERCITWGNEGPPMLPPGYNANLQIVQTPGAVIVRQEMIHGARIIPLDGRPHVGAGIRQWGGDSRGHWEGQTLVVDTTNFNDKINFRGSTSGLHVVERFTRADANTIDYRFTVDDPNTWTRAWSAQVPLHRTDAQIFEYACTEGNYGIANILRAARLEDKAE
jgi:hypothetical protein